MVLRGTTREEVQGLLRLRRYDEEEIRNAFARLQDPAASHICASDERDKEIPSGTVDIRAGLERLAREKETHRAELGLTTLSATDLHRTGGELEASLLGRKLSSTIGAPSVIADKPLDAQAFNPLNALVFVDVNRQHSTDVNGTGTGRRQRAAVIATDL